MSFELHRHHKRKKQISEKKKFGWLDNLIYVFAVLGPLGLLPQIVKIWTEKNAAGVSSLTWALAVFGAFFWLLYGFVHKEKPIMVANILSGLFAVLIVVGIFLYG